MYLAERVKAKLTSKCYVGNMVSVPLYHPVKKGLNVSMPTVSNTEQILPKSQYWQHY